MNKKFISYDAPFGRAQLTSLTYERLDRNVLPEPQLRSMSYDELLRMGMVPKYVDNAVQRELEELNDAVRSLQDTETCGSCALDAARRRLDGELDEARENQLAADLKLAARSHNKYR